MPDLTQPIIKHTPFYPGQWGVPGSDSGLGIRTLPVGRVFYVDSEAATSTDFNDGTDPNFPMSTLAAAFARCTSGMNDVVVLINQATQYPVLAAFDWNKSYTHLVGASADLPGVGQRCRVVALDSVDLTQVMTVSASGCYFKNIQFYNGNNAVAASGAVTVTGSRNLFENCFFAGMAHANPANDAASFSLKVSGSENTFSRCSIGLQTIIRTAANGELVLLGATCYRNKFVDCEFLSWSVTAGKSLIKIDATAVLWTLQLENTLLHNLNMTAGGAAGAAVNNAIVDGQAGFHQIVLRGPVCVVGCTGMADVLTFIWSAEPAVVNTYGIALNPAA